mmetsp:Transcript_11472/g.39999  ORF Transcript_11472/g.39999 Transcript_11472/m.39999 type:complete len:246 (-) Transcript_11472:459-1196(-)
MARSTTSARHLPRLMERYSAKSNSSSAGSTGSASSAAAPCDAATRCLSSIDDRATESSMNRARSVVYMTLWLAAAARRALRVRRHIAHGSIDSKSDGSVSLTSSCATFLRRWCWCVPMPMKPPESAGGSFSMRVAPRRMTTSSLCESVSRSIQSRSSHDAVYTSANTDARNTIMMRNSTMCTSSSSSVSWSSSPSPKSLRDSVARSAVFCTRNMRTPTKPRVVSSANNAFTIGRVCSVVASTSAS